MHEMKIQAVRVLRFEAGHRLVNHESKCATLHGHSYEVHIFCESAKLDQLGRVIDFAAIKESVGSWIEEHWDHTMLLFKDDPALSFIKKCPSHKPVFVCDFNPTAENLAAYLLDEICPTCLRGTEIEVTKVRLYETANCYAEVGR